MAYAFKRTITIASAQVGATDQINYPVLIGGLNGPFAYLATVGSGGSIQNTVTFNGQTVPADLIFTSDSAGTSLLPWEVASYKATTGDIEVWVQVPTVSHTVDTLIYMWYGNVAVVTYQGGAVGAAWDSNFKAVHHLPNGTTLTSLDSTTNGNNGTPLNSPAPVAGQIDGAATFINASTQGISLGNAASVNSLQVPITMTGWFYPTSASGFKTIYSQYKSTSSSQLIRLIRLDSGVLAYYCTTSAGGFQSFSYSGAPSLNNWHYFGVTVSGSLASPALIITLDGTAQTFTPAALSVTPDTTVNLWIGNTDQVVKNEGFDGRIDEIRISNIVRSADWLLAEYNNQKTSSTFVTISAATALVVVQRRTFSFPGTRTGARKVF